MSAPDESPTPDERDAARRREFARLSLASAEWEREKARAVDDPDAFREAAEQEIAARVATFEPESFAPGSTLRKPAPPGVSEESKKPPTIVPFPAAAMARQWRWQWLGAAAAVLLCLALGWATLQLKRGEHHSSNSTAQHDALLLRDGAVRVLADGRIESAPVPDDLRGAIEEAIRRRSVAFFFGSTDTLRGEGGATQSATKGTGTPALLEPLPGTTVESTQPVLRWKPSQDARGYRVTLENSATGDRLESGDLPPTTLAWQPQQPLGRGEIYRWMVLTLTRDNDGGGAVASASLGAAGFKVLSVSAAVELARLRRDFAGSHLLRAVAYAREGLTAEMNAELAALASEHPESALAQDLWVSTAPFR